MRSWDAEGDCDGLLDDPGTADGGVAMNTLTDVALENGFGEGKAVAAVREEEQGQFGDLSGENRTEGVNLSL